MDEYEEIENDDRLAQRLRREARRSRPAFSGALHERVLAAIQAASAPTVTVRQRRGVRGQALSWAMAAAASIALLLALTLAWKKSVTTPRDLTAREGTARPDSGASGKLPYTAPPVAVAPRDLTAKKDADDIDAAAEELANSASGIGDWVRSAAGDGQWGGLDRDAQRALATVAGPLPFDLTFSVATADPD
jgi:hypothetical protein